MCSVLSSNVDIYCRYNVWRTTNYTALIILLLSFIKSHLLKATVTCSHL